MARLFHHPFLFRFFSVALVLALSPAVFAASFDCGKSTSVVEQVICADPALSRLDGALGDGYVQALANLPEKRAAELRGEQRAWLKQRNACAADKTCLTERITERVAVLRATGGQAAVVLDADIRLVDSDPATAAVKLREYQGALASAWLAYLHQFVPAAGVTAAEAQTRYAAAENALRDDRFAQSILRDINAENHDNAVLVLLRMTIGRAGYDDATRPYVHCFLFDGRDERVYKWFGSLYGSTRDSQVPVCRPQGDLFERPAWQRLEDMLRPRFERAYDNSGTIRYASFAQWALEKLRATASPADFLKREPVNHQTAISDVLDAQRWPQAQRAAMLAAADDARETTAEWLRSERGFSAQYARQAADAIVHDWLNMRMEFINENLDDEDAAPAEK